MILSIKNSGYVFVLSILIASCGSNNGSKPAVETPTTNAQDSTAKPANDSTNTTTSDPGNVLPQTANVPAVPTVTSAAGLNPEHGKPGHRCDIAVGAPLDSKPSTPTIQPQTPVSIPAPATVSTTPVATGKGLNPEHGKPGHRCDIAVGAPLDSKPAAVTTTPASPVNITPNATLPKPVTVTQTPAANPTTPVITGAGLNPEHGKPGHRCDIAVGAPLPKQ